MKKQVSLIHSSTLPTVDYAYASKVPEGMNLLFMAGACPLDNKGKVPEDTDFEVQARMCVSNLKAALKEAGATIQDIAYTRVLVASSNQDDLVMAWNAIRKEFGEHDVPSTLSGVTLLGYTNQLVEIEAVAAIADKKD
ncbi:RidA family protein [Neobacillus sp. YIM B06451]|uniref:RidA family protein n=1 Tax=Neobacillus sp. YIM B06451 TaxID=3070994 RepID=UPI00292F0673|nr:RidA family protein [Neobacillus sp. YIM B06451]